MFLETRLSQYFTKILCQLRKKVFTVQSGFSLVLLSLFAGFIFGNLFGTFLDMLSFYLVWNGFVGILLILLIEIVNSLVYGASLPIFWKKLYDNQTGDDSSSRLSSVTVAQARYERYRFTKLLESPGGLRKRARIKRMGLPHQNILNCERALNSFKIGLLFGFFVDSFKVGS